MGSRLVTLTIVTKSWLDIYDADTLCLQAGFIDAALPEAEVLTRAVSLAKTLVSKGSNKNILSQLKQVKRKDALDCIGVMLMLSADSRRCTLTPMRSSQREGESKAPPNLQLD